MSDWKSALKALKKEMFGTQGEAEQTKNEPRIGRSLLEPKPKNQPPPGRSSSNFAGTRHPNSEYPSASHKAQPHLPKRQKPVAPRAPKPVAIRQVPQAQVKAAPPAPPKPRGVPTSFQNQSSSNLTRQVYFKVPDAWVSEGIHTQLGQRMKAAGAVDVFIGLDFGTSYTKAAVGLKDQVFVVDWHGVSACADGYLLPSEYSIMADGSCQIGQAPGVPFDQVRQRLKHLLIDEAVSNASLANAAVFLALVLRYIRAWVYHHHGDKLGGGNIRWMLNIGAPSNGLERERRQIDYLKMSSSAWSMSTSESGPSADQAANLIDSLQPSDFCWNDRRLNLSSLPPDLIGLDVFPEFVAQIAGYVQSAQRQGGLHALIDIGGGTLDVVTFIVHKRDGEDVFPFLETDIRALGTHMLNQNRLVEAPEHDKAKLPDELQPVLSSSEFAEVTGMPEEHIALRDKVFKGEVHQVVHRVFYKTRHKRYRLSDAWTKGLPVFLTGGGGSVDGYKESVQSGGQHCARVMHMMPLPMHPKLAEFSGTMGDYQRVSVACGLAQDAFSLGKLIPARLVENDENSMPCDAERPDRDELYAR